MASMMKSSLHATASSPPSLYPKTSYSPRNARRRPTTYRRQWRLGSLGIRSSGDKSGEESPLIKLDRRNMLIGLGGGMYGATLGLGHDQKAAADPVGPPSLSKCNPAYDLFDPTNTGYACCPPYPYPLPDPEDIPTYVPDFSIPRQRKPIHMMTRYEVSKFEAAIAEMKNLDRTDPMNPWSFTQQAQIHCAYCNGAYDQVGYDASDDRSKNVPLQVHFSSLFLPWHRWYIYFFERILGKLVDDESIALPYWNFDHRDGMRFPIPYSNTDSPLYDENRNPSHARPGIYMDLNYSSGPSYQPPDTTEKLVEGNLCYFKRIFDQGKDDSFQFIGTPIKAGDQVIFLGGGGNPFPYAGGMETLHNTVHVWTGTTEEGKHNFDMGNFISSARDPIFYALHSNVDRLWYMFMSDKSTPDDSNWLDASFVFYDENKQLVKVNVRDSLHIDSLGYSYMTAEPEWNSITCPSNSLSAVKFPQVTPQEFGSMPKALDNDPIRVLVKRPKSSRSKSEIQKTLEVVMVDGIEVEHTSSTRFDVFINTPSENSTHLGDFAGSFTTVAHGIKHGETSDGNVKKLGLKLGITSLVSKLNAEAAESLVVSLVPRMGPVVVGGVRIEQIAKTA